MGSERIQKVNEARLKENIDKVNQIKAKLNEIKEIADTIQCFVGFEQEWGCSKCPMELWKNCYRYDLITECESIAKEIENKQTKLKESRG